MLACQPAAFRKGCLLIQYTVSAGLCQHRKMQGGHRNDPGVLPAVRRWPSCLALERFAVCALVHRRVGLVRAYRDAVERTVLRACAVVGALVNRAADRLVAMGFIHEKDLLF